MNTVSKQYDVLGLGCATVDDLLYVACFPGPDSKTRVLRSDRQCGGLTATALVAASRFGARCAYAGMLGHDALSHCVEENLVREGIDTSHVVRRDDASPIHAVIIVAEQGHTRNIFSEPKGRSGSDDELPPADVIASTRVLFIDHYNTPGNLRAMSIAQAAGVPVVADIERDNVPRFDEVLSLVDHVVMSREFALSLTSARHPADAVQTLWTGRRAAVVVTGGAEGCWYRDHEYSAVRHLPAFAVDVVDTTGCGDVFHGVYAAALARGAGIEQRVQWASAAAALKATQDGGQRGIPLRAQVEAFLTDRP